MQSPHPLKVEMVAVNYRQKDMARDIGLKHAESLSMWLNGVREMPDEVKEKIKERIVSRKKERSGH
jgi:hypothetical protein